MAINSEIKNVKSTKKEQYPCLKVYRGASYKEFGYEFIVLFTNSREGTVVFDNGKSDSPWGVGKHFVEWEEKYFEDFTGELNLKNS